MTDIRDAAMSDKTTTSPVLWAGVIEDILTGDQTVVVVLNEPPEIEERDDE